MVHVKEIYVKAILLSIIVLTIASAFTSCATDDNIYDIDTSDWQIFLFPYDYFPNEISFTTEQKIYPLNAAPITGILRNVSSESQPYMVSMGTDFFIVKYVDTKWHVVPFGDDMFFFDVERILPQSDSFAPFSFSMEDLYHGTLTTGTYRIVTRVAMGLPDDSRGAFDFLSVHWRGYVWTEFTISSGV